MADWLADLRRRASSAFDSIPIPAEKDKGWEFTDLSSLDLGAYAPAADGDFELKPRRKAVVSRNGHAGIRQVDGRAQRLGEQLPDGVVVTTLEEAVA